MITSTAVSTYPKKEVTITSPEIKAAGINEITFFRHQFNGRMLYFAKGHNAAGHELTLSLNAFSFYDCVKNLEPSLQNVLLFSDYAEAKSFMAEN